MKNQCALRRENQRAEKEIFVMTNSRTDVHKFLSIADVFVGISRAALEAMSARVPVILAGQFGYGGIFRPTISTFASKTISPAEARISRRTTRFFEDIMTVYNMPSEKGRRLRSSGAKRC
ncbi:MAG: glycosyltransferase [Clostridiales bacterium]|nr:MAG: glycosyltransferase [Clostridiales bacterium]